MNTQKTMVAIEEMWSKRDAAPRITNPELIENGFSDLGRVQTRNLHNRTRIGTFNRPSA